MSTLTVSIGIQATPHNKSLDASGGSVFRKIKDTAMDE
jgi:hypothetical protein